MTFKKDLIIGLSKKNKRIPSKYHYDLQGSKYFEKITKLLKVVDKSKLNKLEKLVLSTKKKKAKILIISHLGRPNGVRDANLSLLPIYKYIKKKLNTNVFFFMGNFAHKVL